MSDQPGYTAADYVQRWAQVKAASSALDGLSLADELALAESIEPGTLQRLFDQLGPEGWRTLAFDRYFWMRPKQRAVVDFTTAFAFLCGGRGSGKTRPASEWVIKRVEEGARTIAFIGPTIGEVFQVMVGGNKKRAHGLNGSGFLDCLPPHIEAEVKVVKAEIHLSTGAIVYLNSAESPEFRGLGSDAIWCDELLKFRYGERLLSNIRLTAREVGKGKSQVLFTSSPKRMKILRDIVMDPDTTTIRIVTDENRGNVDPDWVDRERKRLDGTRQGSEELDGELGLDEESDMFKLALIDDLRVADEPSFDALCVAVDPAASTTRKSDMTGISLCGRVGTAQDGEGFVLLDLSAKHVWETWGALVVSTAIEHGASAIVLEDNKFSKAVISNVRQCAKALGWNAGPRPGHKTLEDLIGPNGRRIQLVEVNARTDKATRAGPVSTMYEKRRIHHVGHLPELEIEMGDFPSGASPNRLDAMVHAMTFLFGLDRVAPSMSGAVAMKGLAEANARVDASAPSAARAWVSLGDDRRRTI